MMWQMALPLGIQAEQTFDTFHVSVDNAIAVASVQSLVQGRNSETQLVLWGEEGTVAYLPGKHLNDADALLGIENCDLFCVDDVHEISANTEESLFHALNRCRESGTRVLISANAELEALPIELADLKTRLQWGPVFQLAPLRDEALHNALEQLLMARDLTWSEDVVPYMLKRFPRDVGALRHSVMKLDEASMQAKRRITIPFLKTVLNYRR